MIFNSTSIANKINFSAIDTDKFKASVITFSITLPLTPKAVAYNLLLSGLLRRGTRKYPSMAKLNKKLDELYGSYIEIRSSHVQNNISFIVSTEILDNKYIPDGLDTIGEVIDTVSQIFLQPKIIDDDFNKDFFSRECEILTDSLNSEYNNTRAYSIRRCLEMLQFNSENPTLEELKEIVANATFDEILEHYRNMIQSAPLDVFYIGSTESEAVKDRIAKAFSGYPYSSKTKCALNPIVPRTNSSLMSRVEELSVSQGKLAMGFNCAACISGSNDLYYTALVLNEIFGGAPSSKLFINVREKMSLCYYCSSSYSIYTGFMIVSAGIEVSKYDLVKRAILEQFEQIRKGNISKEELNAAKKSLSNSYKQLYDNPFDLQAFYAARLMFGISDSIDTCIKKILAVDISDIVRLANQVELQAEFFVKGKDTLCEEDMQNE